MLRVLHNERGGRSERKERGKLEGASALGVAQQSLLLVDLLPVNRSRTALETTVR